MFVYEHVCDVDDGDILLLMLGETLLLMHGETLLLMRLAAITAAALVLTHRHTRTHTRTHTDTHGHTRTHTDTERQTEIHTQRQVWDGCMPKDRWMYA